MAGSFSDKDNGYRVLTETLKKGGSVLTGLLASDGEQPKQDSPELTLLEVALVNEFGNDRIPERSFLRGWVDANKPMIQNRLFQEWKEVVAGARTRDQALERIGLWAQGQIQLFIAKRIPPPNAPATIRKKGSDVPLVDTGQLRSSISYLVEGR